MARTNPAFAPEDIPLDAEASALAVAVEKSGAVERRGVPVRDGEALDERRADESTVAEEAPKVAEEATKDDSTETTVFPAAARTLEDSSALDAGGGGWLDSGTGCSEGLGEKMGAWLLLGSWY
jgi:hypothetical protein